MAQVEPGVRGGGQRYADLAGPVGGGALGAGQAVDADPAEGRPVVEAVSVTDTSSWVPVVLGGTITRRARPLAPPRETGLPGRTVTGEPAADQRRATARRPTSFVASHCAKCGEMPLESSLRQATAGSGSTAEHNMPPETVT